MLGPVEASEMLREAAMRGDVTALKMALDAGANVHDTSTLTT